MKIYDIRFDLEHYALEFYCTGCTIKCKDCHNVALQDFSVGVEWQEFIKTHKIIQSIKDNKLLIKNFIILGGEPLDQNKNELHNFLEFLHSKFSDINIWLFTGYSFDKIPDIILPFLSYAKTGKYDYKLLVDDNIQYGYKLASSNQKITKIEHNFLG